MSYKETPPKPRQFTDPAFLRAYRESRYGKEFQIGKESLKGLADLFGEKIKETKKKKTKRKETVQGLLNRISILESNMSTIEANEEVAELGSLEERLARLKQLDEQVNASITIARQLDDKKKVSILLDVKQNIKTSRDKYKFGNIPPASLFATNPIDYFRLLLGARRSNKVISITHATKLAHLLPKKMKTNLLIKISKSKHKYQKKGQPHKTFTDKIESLSNYITEREEKYSRAKLFTDPQHLPIITPLRQLKKLAKLAKLESLEERIASARAEWAEEAEEAEKAEEAEEAEEEGEAEKVGERMRA
jgi:hypothetical protein